VTADPKALPEPPRLPQRAAIYIAKDGTVHFGALFEGLVPVARALGALELKQQVADGRDDSGEADAARR
jgi:hypothetical protein